MAAARASLPDHLDSLRAAQPVVRGPAGAALAVDAQAGVAQPGFDLVFDDLVGRAKTFGLALLTQRDCYPAGELGHFARRLAEAGLIGLAAGNAHALMAVAAGDDKVFSTDPLAFARHWRDGRGPRSTSPRPRRPSSTSCPRPRRSAPCPRVGRWMPTTDALAATDGALLPFGGCKGANIALMVEILAAGLTGGAWSMDTGHFLTGTTPPGGGMVVLAIAPTLCAPDFTERLTLQLDRLAGQGVHVPGQKPRTDGLVQVAAEVLDRPTAWATGAA